MGACSSAGWLASMLAAALLSSACLGEGEWAYSSCYCTPSTLDHESPAMFVATFVYLNGTGEGNITPGSGEGPAPGNGTGGNGTGSGTNSTSNMTATANVTNVQLVIGQNSSRPGAREERYDMAAQNGSAAYQVKLGPWAPGSEFAYRFEANLSNGTALRTNDSHVRIPVLIGVKWHSVRSEAAALARSLDRPLLVFAYSDWDHTSEYMQSGPFTDPLAVELSARFVCLRLDADGDQALASELNISSTPTLLFLDQGTGMTIEKRSGAFSNDTLVREMKYVLHMGPRPATAAPTFPERTIMLGALGLVFIVGCGLMYYYYFRKNKLER